MNPVVSLATAFVIYALYAWLVFAGLGCALAIVGEAKKNKIIWKNSQGEF